MALTQEQLMRMARHGAAAMIAELKHQIAEIERTFPGVSSGRDKRPAGAAKPGRPADARARRSMSAAQRRAVSVRMKKYWAARRAENGKSAKK